MADTAGVQRSRIAMLKDRLLRQQLEHKVAKLDEVASVGPDETVILLHPPVPLLGVSTGINRGCHQHDSLVNG